MRISPHSSPLAIGYHHPPGMSLLRRTRNDGRSHDDVAGNVTPSVTPTPVASRSPSRSRSSSPPPPATPTSIASDPHAQAVLSTVLLPRFYSPRISPYLMITAVTGSTILQTYFQGALTIALPTIGDALGFGGESLQWPLTMYSLLNGSFLLLMGALADAYGRRVFFLLGILWLMAFSLALTFATTSTQFIALCAALGIGSAILSPASTGLLSFLPQGNLRNTSYAFLGAGQPIGFVIGIFAGGFLSKNWHVILYIMTGSSFVFALLALVSLPSGAGATTADDAEAHTPAPGKLRRLLTFDWFGAFLLTAGLILLTFALADAGSNAKGWKSPFVPAMLPLASLSLLSFGLWEYRAERRLQSRRSKLNPLLPPSIWKTPTFTPLLVMVFFAWANFNTVTYFGTLYIQEVQKLSPFQAAIRFVPMVVSGIVYNLFTGLTMAKVHGLWLIVLGCIGAGVACIVYGVMSPTSLYWSTLFVVFNTTTATDILFPVAQLHACNCVGPRRAALAGGLFNTVTRLATSLGLSITASISSAVTKQYMRRRQRGAGGAAPAAAPATAATPPSPEALLKGYQAAVWFCFALSVIALAIGIIWLRGIGIVGFQEKQRGGGEGEDKQDPTSGGRGDAHDVANNIERASHDNDTDARSQRDVKRSFADGDATHLYFGAPTATAAGPSGSSTPAVQRIVVDIQRGSSDGDGDVGGYELDTIGAASKGRGVS